MTAACSSGTPDAGEVDQVLSGPPPTYPEPQTSTEDFCSTYRKLADVAGGSPEQRRLINQLVAASTGQLKADITIWGDYVEANFDADDLTTQDPRNWPVQAIVANRRFAHHATSTCNT